MAAFVVSRLPDAHRTDITNVTHDVSYHLPDPLSRTLPKSIAGTALPGRVEHRLDETVANTDSMKRWRLQSLQTDRQHTIKETVTGTE